MQTGNETTKSKMYCAVITLQRPGICSLCLPDAHDWQSGSPDGFHAESFTLQGAQCPEIRGAVSFQNDRPVNDLSSGMEGAGGIIQLNASASKRLLECTILYQVFRHTDLKCASIRQQPDAVSPTQRQVEIITQGV